MKKLVLLGDSIRLIGYGKRLAELLSDRFEVWQPEDNCRWADYTYRLICDKQSEINGADVIHWNNGHWDICDLFGEGEFTSPENYARALRRVAVQLKKMAPVVIFSTTTPVKPALSYENNERIKKYNEVATEALRDTGVIVNDLYSFVEPHLYEYIGEDNIHLNELGAEACAERLAKIISQY